MVDWANFIRAEIARFVSRHNRGMVGFIDAYDPQDHTAKVKFPTELDANGQPRISGWLPIQAQAGGAGASWIIGPQVGDQCTVEHIEGSSEAGKITGFLHNTVDTPPTAQSSEAVLRHTPTGNYFKLNADGSFQHFHVASKNYAKVDKNGNLISHIQQPPGTTFVYLGGDPAASPTPVFSPVSTVAGPSPYLMGRMS